MECHDVRLLLSFAYRGCENLDVTEREALEQHLGKCPGCAACAQADRQLDQTLGKVMRDVPIPADLKHNVLKRLAAQRRPVPWKWVAAAAAVLIAVSTMGIVRHLHAPPEIEPEDVQRFVFHQGNGYDAKQVEQFFADQGLKVRAPRIFRYEFLERADIVEFKGRRVAKLTFFRPDGGDERAASAEVLILSAHDFNLSKVTEMEIPGTVTIRIRAEDDFRFLISSRGRFDALLVLHNS